VDPRAIWLLVNLSGREHLSDEYGALRLNRGDSYLLDDGVYARELRGRRATSQVVQRDQRVRLSAAEVGL
jgi:hypothetical protein